jgi:hypothetical protein
MRNATLFRRSWARRSIARRFTVASRAQVAPVPPTLTFDLLASLRKGTGVRRNILRQKIG